MGYEVFVSYARSSAGLQARMLADELIHRGHNAILDTRDIPPGAPFPDELAAAVHNAGVVVIFADANYFSREWCLREFDSAVAAAGPRVVVALPTEGVPDAVILPLPPSVARGSWPAADQTAILASLVEGVLAGERSRDLAVPGASSLLPDGIARPALFRGDQPVMLEGAAETLDNRFIGRAQAKWQVFHALETRRFGGAPRVVLVSGGGGSGKSQLAVEYVRRVGPRYYHAVFWTSADAPLAAHQQSLRAILAALGIANADLARLEALIGSRLVALAREGKRVLWVVDNVPEASAGQPAPSLSTWCPATKYVSLLATSRRHRLFGAHETISLGPLDVSAGIELLTTPDVDARWLGEDDWREIVRWVGSLPLALRILQAGLSDGTLAAQALLERTGGQALVHASSYAPAQMFPKLVRVAQSDPSPQIRQQASLAFRPWISEGGEGMRLVAAYCTAELKSAPAAVTQLALQLAGEIIAFCRDTDPQSVAGLVPQLEGLATAGDTSDQARANALAAAHALGQHTDTISFDALSKTLAATPDVPDDPVRLLAIDVLGEYLKTIDAPRRPTDIHFEYDDDGGLVLRGKLPPTVHRPELSGALIDLVTRGAGPAAQHALSRTAHLHCRPYRAEVGDTGAVRCR